MRIGLINEIADPVLERALDVAHSLAEERGRAGSHEAAQGTPSAYAAFHVARKYLIEAG